MGGDMQPQGHMQDAGAHARLPAAPAGGCDAPRWRWNGGIVNRAGFPEATAQGLQRPLGHRVEPFADSYQDYGAGQFIWRLPATRPSKATWPPVTCARRQAD